MKIIPSQTLTFINHQIYTTNQLIATPQECYSRCVPSQNGGVCVRPQRHIKARRLTMTVPLGRYIRTWPPMRKGPHSITFTSTWGTICTIFFSISTQFSLRIEHLLTPFCFDYKPLQRDYFTTLALFKKVCTFAMILKSYETPLLQPLATDALLDIPPIHHTAHDSLSRDNHASPQRLLPHRFISGHI